MTGTPRSMNSSSHIPGVPYAGFNWQSAMDILRPSLPPALIHDEQTSKINEFTGDVPGIWHWGMFETRLSSDDAPVDILGAMVQGEETREKLLETLTSTPHSPLSPSEALLRRWAANDGTGFSGTPNLWLEWDRDGDNRPPVPWLCTAPDFFDKKLTPLSADEVGKLAADFMASDPQMFVPGAAEKLVELTRLLPPGGKLSAFATLQPRGRAICRAFARLPKGGTRKWLKAIGWPGNIDQFEAVAPLFQVDGESEWCQIEFDTKVRAHLALEIAQSERGFPRKEARVRWLNEAVSRGWTSREKADAVLGWHGKKSCTLPSGEAVDLLRSFHLKVTLAAETEPQAKAYLGFYFRKTNRSTQAS